jgi:urea transport system substrate-binding protein
LPCITDNLARQPTRRDLLVGGGKAATLAAAHMLAPFVFSGCDLDLVRRKETPIKVGLLHSQTGKMSISESSLCDTELMAIEEINAQGGVLGRPIEAIVEDGRSRFTDVFPRKARKLLVDDKVAAVFGCWTSASRKAVLPVFEEHNGLLFYPVQYEGNEASRNVIYTGAAPNQQILPAIDWLLSTDGGSRKRFYLIGSDYIFPRTASFILRKYLESKSVDIVREKYTPFGHEQYEEIVRDIRDSKSDVVFSTINGDSNIGFYRELAAQGVTADKVPVVATSVGEDELRYLLPEWVTGHLAAWNYFQSVDSPINKEFVRRFKAEHGWDRVTDDPMEAAYFQVYLWKLAVEKAGDFDVDGVRDVLGSDIEFDAPEGKVKIDPKTHHTYKRFRLGRVRDDRQFDIVFESPDWIAPNPYPGEAFPGWSCDWTKGGVTRGVEVKIPMS